MTKIDILLHAGIYKMSLLTAAHELDPDGKQLPIALVVKAIDLRVQRGTGTKAGDYYDECLEAALNCSYVWDSSWTPTAGE